ncbi:hypothetical protein DSUL_100149 [Desulfovibrionales bacterium]
MIYTKISVFFIPDVADIKVVLVLAKLTEDILIFFCSRNLWSIFSQDDHEKWLALPIVIFFNFRTIS